MDDTDRLVIRIKCPGCSRVIEDAPDDFGPRPFCSPTCKLDDLSNWLNDLYRIPGEVVDLENSDVDGSTN
jgi:endogenous inhibitor of DNA gyrase (YacG/DUF329 family)